MLDFLSVGLAAGSNPNNNDPGEAQIAVPSKTNLYSSTQHRRFLLLQFRNKKISKKYSTLHWRFLRQCCCTIDPEAPKPIAFRFSYFTRAESCRLWETFSSSSSQLQNSETQNQSRRRWVPGPSSHQNSWASDPNLKCGRAPQNIDELALKIFAMIASPSSSSPPSSSSSPFFLALFLLLSNLVQVLLHTWILATSRS